MNLQDAPAALSIFFITLGISLYTMFGNQSWYDKLLLSPYKFVHENKWYTLLTSGFIHADTFHLFFNMMTFYFFAFRIEETVGSIEFLIIYLGSIVFSDISSILKNKNNPDYRSLGASGGIAGILFSYILFYPSSKISIMFIPIGIPAPIFAVLYLAYCYYASKNAQDYINHEAHLWGALSGLVLTAILIPNSILYFIKFIL